VRQIPLVLFLFLVARGQDSRSESTFTSENVSHSYPGSYSSIMKVDFRNFSVPSFDQSGSSIRLKNGRHKMDEPGSVFSMELDSIYYLGTLSSSRGSSALVLYSWFAAGGSSSQGGTARVYTVSDGQLKSVQTIDWDTHFQAGRPTESFDPATNTLVIRSAHYLPEDAHCCVSAMDVVAYRWDGAHFVQVGIQTELSEYGKKEGKPSLADR
jgi:hypothetical protein